MSNIKKDQNQMCFVSLNSNGLAQLINLCEISPPSVLVTQCEICRNPKFETRQLGIPHEVRPHNSSLTG